ncbi:MAG: rod shape-determining protein MreC [Bacteroidota bacterium]|nr:rod shape-determining protein MreC [Bacteroidota bacterium]
MRQLINALLKYQNTLLYLGLLILSLIFLNHRSFYHQSIFSNAFLVISSNFNLLGKNVSNYMSLSENNEKLRAENIKLKALELIYFNQQSTRKIVIDSFDFEVFGARIIKNSYNNARNYLIIDQGYEDGIELEMAVISCDGIIGIVNQVTADFSSVISILHRDLKINAGFKKNGAYGTLSWTGNHPKIMKLNDVSTLNKVMIGDTIITGGFSDYFPYGIPIGKVLNFKRTELQGYFDIDIELFSNLTQKEFVYVLKNKNIAQLNELKNESR